MTKAELVDKIWDEIPIYRRNQLHKKWIRFVVDEVFDNIKECAVRGEPVTIHKFGKFYLKRIKGRPVYNPSLGKTLMSEDKQKLRFKQGSSLTGLLQESIS